MRNLHLVTALWLGVSATAALAQTPPAPVARPGHEPGVGTSLPLSNKASNIDATDTKTTTAPTLPDSGLGDDATPFAYLHTARDALVAGRTGQAQQALEMAETRVLDRSVDATKVGEPSNSTFVSRIAAARDALGRGDTVGAIGLIDVALAH